jgi:predicted Zn-dependent protease
VEAIPFLEKVVKSDPNHMPARAALGLAYLRVGRAAEAIPHLKAARDVEDDGSLYYQLAQAYQRAGQQPLARENMQRFEEISKTARARRQKLPEEFEITPP